MRSRSAAGRASPAFLSALRRRAEVLGLLNGGRGKTPALTMAGTLWKESKRKHGAFVRLARGTYWLRSVPVPLDALSERFYALVDAATSAP